MAVRYYVVVANELLPAIRENHPHHVPECMRFVQEIGPGDPGTTLVEFDDDNAPAELAGRMVQPWFQSHYDGRGNITHVTVLSRERVVADA